MSKRQTVLNRLSSILGCTLIFERNFQRHAVLSENVRVETHTKSHKMYTIITGNCSWPVEVS